MIRVHTNTANNNSNNESKNEQKTTHITKGWFVVNRLINNNVII